MPLSGDDEARARQLANLRPGAGAAGRGNRRRVQHGGYSRVAGERLEAKVAEVFEALTEDAPLGDPGHAAAIRLAAEALCRADDVAAFLRDHGIVDPKTGELRAALDVERKLRLEAADHLDALGMTARSQARLGLDRARTFDLAATWAAEEAERDG